LIASVIDFVTFIYASFAHPLRRVKSSQLVLPAVIIYLLFY